MKKITFVIVLSFIIIFSSCNYFNVYGFDKDTSIIAVLREWRTLGDDRSKDIPMGDTDYWNVLAGVLTAIGIWVILISGTILGIRFMIAEPDKKAEVKKSLMIWLVGTVIILGAVSIWKLLVNILDSI